MFKDRLRQLRIENELNQIELSKRLNVAKQTVSNWENGNRTPDSDMLIKLADFFSCTVDYLLDRSESKEGIVSEADIDGHHYEFELDRKVFPNGLTYDQMVKKLKALEKLEKAGFKFDPEDGDGE
ncbi:helix-turn-helix domain-containing protein [Clostridium sp.]|jgi:transcriptional regulator with XRE-family HTH domain|uniref:helix-turn-helix domain-containing protein n=1 Tax=Clostridium sp. TaxID=1506 RepID=UPI00258D5CD4|nr:helix-turn-helix domain-containing protein [Clostridium sp.]MDF2502782.1 DNA-binding helix-turn-helix protein [Clostridium sp.]